MKCLASSLAARRVATLSSLLLAASFLSYVSARPAASRPAPRHVPATAEARANAPTRERAPWAVPERAPRLAIDFVENRGQWQGRAAYAARAGGMLAAFERGAVRLRVGKERPAQLALSFEGHSPNATLAGEGRRAGRYNYFVGRDTAKWRSNVASFASVLYRGLYEGVDMRVREEAGRLEYDLILAPGADLGRVVVRTDGASEIELADDGSLVVRTDAGELRQTPPRTWEVLPTGERRPVECRFRKIDARRYGFTASGRDPANTLVIDPGLEWSTYVGGGEWDEINDLAAANDGTGDVIAVGATLSDDFSNRANPVVGFVTRFNSTGALVYKTILSGSDREWIHGVAVAAGGEPVVVGESYSPDYPVTPGAYDTTHGFRTDALGAIYESDAFVTRLDAAGQITYSTFIGGDLYDLAYTVALAPGGAVVVAGETMSPDWPTTDGAFDRTHNCCTPYFGGVFSRLDAFVARLSADGSALEYSTYLGGNGDEPPESVVVDAAGFVTLTGLTYSPPGGGPAFPTTPDALSRTPFNIETNPDAYLARLRLDGAGSGDLKYATFIGGGNTDAGYAVALDPLNAADVIVGGVTYSMQPGVTPTFRTTPGTIKPTSTSIDGFLMRFRFSAAGGGSLVWSTLFGGVDYEEISDLAVQSNGEIVMAGQTRSFDLPTTQGAFDRSVAISSGALFFDAFAARVSGDGARLLYGTYLGGSFNERFMNLALLATNDVAVSGWTNSGDFPTTPGAHDPVLNNDGIGGVGGGPGGIPFDGFLSRLTLAPDGDGDDAVVTPALLSPANGAQTGTNTVLTFDWSDVPDQSGIDGYHFQINQRPDFVCCNDWQEVWVSRSEYSTSVRFEGPYYWRVRAADRSGNVSEWSEVRTLNSGTTVSVLRLDPTTVNGGGTAQGQVSLTAQAPSGGITISLSSGDTSVATVPASVTIPQGGVAATFTVRTSNVSAPTPVAINATHAGNTRSATLNVTPATGPLAAPTLVSPASDARVPLNVSVTFSWNAAAGAATYEIQIDDSDRFSAPLVASQAGLAQTQYAQVFKAEKRMWWRVRGRTSGGTNGAWSSVRSFLVRRGATTPTPSPVALSTLSLSPTTVTGGGTSKGTITLTAAAPSGGAVVALSSSNASAAAVPASITVPAGATSAAFTVATNTVTAPTSVAVTAAYNGVTRTASLSVQPAPTQAPVALSALSLNPTGITGGGSSQGRVTLSAPAPSGGASVALSSSNSAAASVPASVAVPAGANSATFNVTTNSVAASTAVSISASYGGASRTATLTISPAQAGDTVAVQVAEYDSGKRELRVEATSTNGSAVLRCYVTSTGALIGTLSNDGGGRYRAQFSVSSNPQSITVRSSLGGSATRTVSAR